jgi:hypothetical protein
MNLDAKIAAAVRCLEREYPKGVDPAALDDVITEITREHRAEFRQRCQPPALRPVRPEAQPLVPAPVGTSSR